MSSKKGFTLIELLTALAISGVVIVLCFLMISKITRTNQELFRIQKEYNDFLSYITYLKGSFQNTDVIDYKVNEDCTVFYTIDGVYTFMNNQSSYINDDYYAFKYCKHKINNSLIIIDYMLNYDYKTVVLRGNFHEINSG